MLQGRANAPLIAHECPHSVWTRSVPAVQAFATYVHGALTVARDDFQLAAKRRPIHERSGWLLGKEEDRPRSIRSFVKLIITRQTDAEAFVSR